MLRTDQVHVIPYKMLVGGRSKKSVARQLGVSRTTVDKYLKVTLELLGILARNDVGLV